MPIPSMAAMVSREKRTFTMVRPYILKMFGMLIPITNPERIAASKIPDPVALSQFSANTAGSFVGFGTTGGTRCTRLFNPVTGNVGFVIALGSVCHVAMRRENFLGRVH